MCSSNIRKGKCHILFNSTATNCPAPVIPDEAENGEGAGDANSDGGVEAQANDVQQQEPQAGPSGDVVNVPNAETCCSKPKRYNKHQQPVY